MQYDEDDTIEMKVIRQETQELPIVDKVDKLSQLNWGDLFSTFFAGLLVFILLVSMGWTMFVTLKCNYCCSGPPLVNPYIIPEHNR